ncbi:M20/M25/M40 family metallo-hydrolase [Neobacillus soli]|uniref:M20/M25/M40 family metallo-hydrolase n=1 Tax=Neobacillus soli TaxID=220688 RepID=UPI001F4505B8|nr:M20/M25/M40 family metallo-hydrolase [Neobacillus soli]
MVPLQVTGSPKDRLNLIIFGDGYTPQEMDKFRQDVERNQNVQWSVEPFRSYRYYFNVYMVETPSKDSGISCDPDDGNVRRDTVLGLEYATKCPAEKLARGITYSTAGNTSRNNLLSQYVAPALGIASNAQNIQTLALANTFTYGGIGGVQATTSGGSPQGPLVSTHELGHSLGNLQDEYPYSSREVPGTPHPNSEPSSVHHTRMTSAEMIDKKAKWWRWLGEESESGGIIRAADPDGYESGSTRGSNVWRPSEHSMMRWLGFYFDQVGREQMTQRITGMRNANEMPMTSTPVGEVGSHDVVWVETMHPRFHALEVAWEVNGKEVANSHNSRFLKLSDLNVKTGDTVKVTVKDKTEFVRDPSFLDGPRMTQTRQWTVGKALPKTSVNVIFNTSTPTNRAVAHNEVVFVETPYPNDRVLNVTWTLNGEKLTETNNSRLLDLGKLNLPSGSSKLIATLTDPAGSGSDTITWTVDNGLPTAPRTLSEPLTTLADDVEHNVYFNEFDVLLKPEDDQPGFVVGELRLNKDGWFNYFGFPEKPVGTPFKFSHSGSDVKALTYGNLGKGGPSKATFEQSYTAKDPGGAFVPGFGTHLVEHRAIDATGNIGNSDSFKATVLPGNLPTCTTTLTGNQNGIDVTEGVICLKNATVDGEVTVHQGASLVVFNSTINGSMHTEAANAVQMFGTTVNGPSYISGTVSNVTLAGNKFNDDLDLSNNNQISANKQYGEYGPIMAGNYVDGSLYCIGNSSTVTDFGAGNDLGGTITGQCRTLNPKQPVVGAEAYKHTEYLSEKIGTRVTGTANEEKAGTYLFDEMEKLGFQPIKQKFSYTTRGVTTNTANIIGVRKGNTNNTTHKQIIVGAHYDSVNVGRGADDNASSIGVILETAKALQKKNLQYDIKFIFFGAEETGTRGSNYYVSQMSKEEIANTVAMINLDSLLAGDKVYAYGSPGAKGWIRDLAFDIADKKHIPLETNPGLNKSYPKGTTGDWSDHAAFQKAGIPIGYLEATNWEIGDLDGYTQTVKHGGIWHTKNDNLAFLEKEFPGRVAAHLEQFTLILTGLLTNIEKVK